MSNNIPTHELNREDQNLTNNINISVSYREYKCDKCSKIFYDQGFNNICPHCGNKCDDDVMGNWEYKDKTIKIKLDRKTGKIIVS